MDQTTGQQSPTIIPSSPSTCCSFLAGSRGWSHTVPSSRQRHTARRMPWIRQSQGLVNFNKIQQGRCRSTSFAFKRHLEHRDQEPSSKHFLSEDKMAARFNSLSLDNDHVYSSNGFPLYDEDPKWQEAYARLKELQQRLSQDGASEEASSDEDEHNSVLVDGEFIMADCPILAHPSFLQEPVGGVSLVPEEVFLSLNPCTEVVLWSPPSNSGFHSIRTLMAIPSALSSPAQPQQEAATIQEEMEI
ncbi:host cell factor C1 regulator 1 isoform X1 [Podarcis muralis]